MEVFKKLTVVAGILLNQNREVLIALRPLTVAEPGLCEFPGGKVEPGETLETALIREFQEEIGIVVTKIKPFLTVEHQNATHCLILNSFLIMQFQKEPKGCENQEIRWVPIDTLEKYEFPKANADIVKAVSAIRVF